VRRYLRVVALVAILGLVAAACGGDDDGATTTGPTGETTGGTGQTGAELAQGGTLELAMIGDVSAAFDPQKEYYSVTWEWFRCCLLRTLLSYTGRPTAEGGVELQPDIATALPEISSDGLTYTFTLKSGINYAPPFEDVSVTSQDIVRALEREADPDAAVNGYNFYYNIIKGFSEFGAGDADTIEGLSTPDESTLVVELTGPSGYLPYLFAMHATAPIPPDAADERLGAAEGHTEDYGRFLVATGPYMFAGSENLDFSVPADDQDPVSGYNPGQSIQLVRNPSYDPATDGLRPAYPDAINVSIGGDEADLFNQVVAGQLDMVVDGVVPAQILRQYSTDPTLQPYLHINPSDAVRYIAFNLAEPPFDDVHVRKAFNLALDKSSMRTLRGGESVGEIAGHIMVNSLENNLLADYDPYPTPNSAGDVNQAKEEIKQSAYDSDGDGVCDDPVCKDILAVTDEADPYPDQAALIQQNMEPLGLTFDVKSFERTTMYNKCNEPEAHVAACFGPGWGKDFPDGYTFADPLFGSAAIFPSCCNYGLVGASSELLSKAGYDVTEVPSVDDQISAANEQTGDARYQAWADLDTTLMEDVVPWAPYLFDNNVDVYSARVINYSFDQFSGLAAWDQLAIDPSAQ
jgi:peptide/nickel transport system substrate-binding protein